MMRVILGVLVAVALVLAFDAESAEQLRVRIGGTAIVRGAGGGGGGGGGGGNGNPNALTGAQITSNYLGGFRMPDTASNGLYMDAAPAAIAFNPASGRIFANTRVFGLADGEQQKVAELIIPTLISSSTPGGMNRATYGQGITEPMEAANVHTSLAVMDYCTLTQRQNGSCQPASLIALAVHGTRLIFSYGIGYDSDNIQLKSHFSRPVNFATTGDVIGPVRFGDGTGLDLPAPAPHPTDPGNKGFTGFHAGYMGNVPTARQAALGGYTMMSGWVAPSIITRTSYGPSAGGFDPDAITAATGTRTWKVFVAYPHTHTTLGPWQAAGPNFGIATQVKGMVILDGTDTVAFFGTHGDTYCYGTGHSDPGIPNGTDDPNDPDPEVKLCYDPTSNVKGNHGYPYHYSMWLYDINDFIAVQNGTKNAWDVIPYQRFNVTFPLMPAIGVKYEFQGATWDPATRRLFLSQYAADPGIGSFQGIVQVFQVPTP